MSRYYSYLNTASSILSGYKGEEPFSSYIKKFFASEKKYGSKDRKQIAHLCYFFFRIGQLAPDRSTEERIAIGLFLCSSTSNDILATISPEFNEYVSISLNEKLSYLGVENVSSIFPCVNELSNEIELNRFILSHFNQPDLFLRVRPGQKKIVLQKLNDAGISFKEMGEHSLSLSSATRIEDILVLDKEVVVQDISSQNVGFFFKEVIEKHLPETRILDVWDACAASGGKSIMIHDLFPGINLTVSDIRESIIANLKKRFANAGMRNYKSLVADLSRKGSAMGKMQWKKFDLVIADVPCSGSGTWGRTPDNLSHFECGKIEEYATLQTSILSEITERVKKGGLLLYITCSVYEKENMQQVEKIMSRGFEVLQQKLLQGFEDRGDSMFVAVLRKI